MQLETPEVPRKPGTVEVKSAFTTKEVNKKQVQALPENCGLAEHKENHWVVDIDPKHTIDELMDPGYWTLLTAANPQMQPLDQITARWLDGTKIVHLRIRHCERTFAKVKVISIEELGMVSPDAPDELARHRVEWKGPVLFYCVIRNSDNEIVQNKIRDKAQAKKWAADHEKT